MESSYVSDNKPRVDDIGLTTGHSIGSLIRVSLACLLEASTGRYEPSVWGAGDGGISWCVYDMTQVTFEES
jgi:hypothetical protein